MAAIRGIEKRQRARFAKIMRGADKDSDMYALGDQGVKALLREEGLLLQLPLPAEVSELLHRLHALPPRSAARVWGDRLAGFRTAILAIDAKFKLGDLQAGKDAETLPKREDLEGQAAQAGVAPCARMAIDPASARIYAQIALSDAGDAGSVGEMVVAVRRRDPWLTVRAEPDACALPNAGDLGAAERFSTYAAGIWKEPDGTVGVTVGSISDGGTLTRTASGTRWTPFSITFTPEDGLRRVGRCPR